MRQYLLTATRVTLALALLGLQTHAASGQAPATAPPPSTAPQAPASGAVRRLSVDDAVRLALEQNLDIQVGRMNPRIADLGIAQAQAVWTPSMTAGLTRSKTVSPANSFLSGGQQSVTSGRFSTSAGVNQLLRWGANYSVSWDGSRSTTTNQFSNFNPSLGSDLGLQYTQSLLRNFKIDSARQQLLISKKSREISDVTLRQTVVTTVRSVKNAYWDLSYAVASLAVQRQSLELAQTSLRDTRARVDIGTLAPIDVVEAEAEVAQRDEAVIVAEATIGQAEDRLRSLILDPASPDFWGVRFDLADTAPFEVRTVDVDAAVRTALEKRTDIQQSRKNLEASDVNISYFRNQTLPDLNVQVNYGTTGLGGTQFLRGEGFPGPIIGSVQRGFGSVLGDIVERDFPNWTFSFNVGYPVGASTAEANLARARLQYSQAQLQMRNLELQVAAQVRDAGRQVTTNLKRVEATRAARALSERRLQAEEKKLAAGTSTSYVVFQVQRDLAQARNNEIKAILDYNTSLVDFDAVQETAVTGGGSIVIAGSGSSGTSTAAASAGAASSGSSAGSSSAQGQVGP